VTERRGRKARSALRLEAHAVAAGARPEQGRSRLDGARDIAGLCAARAGASLVDHRVEQARGAAQLVAREREEARLELGVAAALRQHLEEARDRDERVAQLVREVARE
jgi:hypothetical protein